MNVSRFQEITAFIWESGEGAMNIMCQKLNYMISENYLESTLRRLSLS